MPTRKEQLSERTLKGQTDGEDERVFQVLNSEPKNLILHRTTHVLAGVIKVLIDKNLLSEDEIDEILLNAKR